MHRSHRTTLRRPSFGRLAARLALAALCVPHLACGPGPVGDIVPRPDPTPEAVEPGGEGSPTPAGTRKSPKPTRTPTPAPGSKGGGSGAGGGGGSRENGGEARRSPRPGDGRAAQPTPARDGRSNGTGEHGSGNGKPSDEKPEAGKPDGNKPETTKPDGNKSEGSRPEGARPPDDKAGARESAPADSGSKPPEASSKPAETPAKPADAPAEAAVETATPASPAPADATPAPTPAPGDSARAMPFTEQELERYLAAAAGLREKGLDRPGGPAGGDVERFRQEWSAVLSTHGFDDASYRRLNESVAWAFQASELSGDAGIEATAAAAVEDRLSAMAGRIPDERLARLREGMLAAERDKFRQYASVPEPNLALARRFRDRLAPILGK